jgi:hypothetical protein
MFAKNKSSNQIGFLSSTDNTDITDNAINSLSLLKAPNSNSGAVTLPIINEGYSLVIVLFFQIQYYHFLKLNNLNIFLNTCHFFLS